MLTICRQNVDNKYRVDNLLTTRQQTVNNLPTQVSIG